MISNEELISIYRTNITPLYRFFYYKTGNKTASEDLTSEAFITFVEMLREDTLVENKRAFLYGIAKNIFIKYLKKKYKVEEIGYSDDETFNYEIEAVASNDTTSITPEERLLKYLDKIPEKQGQVLRLRLIDKLSLKEIAKALSKDMNYVKTTQKRALKSIRKAVECTPEATNIMTKRSHI